MAQQNKSQPKAKTGLARCLELASGHKWLLFLSGFLAALAAICSFAHCLSIYYVLINLLHHSGNPVCLPGYVALECFCNLNLGLACPGWYFGEHRILLFCLTVFPHCSVWNAL